MNSQPTPHDPGSGAPERRVAFGADSPNLDALAAALCALEEAERLARRAEADRLVALAELERVAALEAQQCNDDSPLERSFAYRATIAEAAVALHVTERSTERQVSQAAQLVTQYPATVDALREAKIARAHALVVLDAGSLIGELGVPDTEETRAVRASFEARVLEVAEVESPNRLRTFARRVAEQHARVSLEERHEREKQNRNVWLTPREDGMAELGAYLPADTASAIFSRITQAAKQQAAVDAGAVESNASEPATPAESPSAEAPSSDSRSAESPSAESAAPFVAKRRSLGELRADVFSELLLDGDTLSAEGAATGQYFSIQGIVQVSTPLSHLLDADSSNIAGSKSTGHQFAGSQFAGSQSADSQSADSQSPGAHSANVRHSQLPLPELQGYGPIPVSMAKRIAAEAPVWFSAITDPETGNVLSVDRYRPSEQQKRFLAIRDERCRFLGCQMPAHRCEIDHTVDAALGGPTTTTNLGHLCKSHHRLKHHSGWKVIQRPDGNYEWTSPTGRRRVDRPPSRVRFKVGESSAGQTSAPVAESRVNLLVDHSAEASADPPDGHTSKASADLSSDAPEIPEWATRVDPRRPIEQRLGPEVEFPF
ncbi:HNH endonuclease signature motif containing protein [Leucobacter denitrificans]|uniref:DUF222 domain-containing protein n=1 Tax=Leucobacter denitrificans TaxID=683042 RepID=A0A7G9S6A3_9MICO|nr:HNH endonuclease signature motif containing protein [Leucobacter denitrificans]QNN63378.1 DUF222 domain-containing protein [Leucobacter denitrificans]